MHQQQALKVNKYRVSPGAHSNVLPSNEKMVGGNINNDQAKAVAAGAAVALCCTIQ
jgi:hypothetical protein